MSETPEQAEARRANALVRAISTPRYASYLHAAARDNDLARRIYVWDRDLATAILADLAIVEVALRNAMHTALSTTYGPAWYEQIPLDDRSQGQITRAWRYLVNPIQADPTTPGRLVSQCMFGMWVNLLDAGGYAGKPPRRGHADYENLWRTTLNTAFPGGRTEARNDADPNARFTRAWVHSIAKTVNVLRNRVAHHEPLHNGFPLPGQQTGQHQPARRLTAAAGIESYMKLTRMIDRDLAEWITHNTRVRQLLADRPQ
ncbi:hypothetical protein [Mycobacteroides saopaulense]|uniref:hypothetical protein n=1 Tax=Mycobacteroides saopaulense TaxID=1578165 RepID=UPI0009F38D98|nr:hypothetical protein [Mycobacteroides saopaulense]